MPVVLIGSMEEPSEGVDEWLLAVLPNRKVLVNPEFEGLKGDMENTIKVRSEFYTDQTGEEHMPIDELFSEILKSWAVMGSTGDVYTDEAAKRIIQKAGLK